MAMEWRRYLADMDLTWQLEEMIEVAEKLRGDGLGTRQSHSSATICRVEGAFVSSGLIVNDRPLRAVRARFLHR